MLQSSSKQNAAAAAIPGGKSVEETYQKKSQIEHILIRPDSYIGSIESFTSLQWLLNEETGKMEQRTITYVPGLLKIFDEIAVNAADNRQRDSTMTTIKITIDAASNTVSVWNDGAGIPVAIHKEHNVYVPELIFGHLLTGSNYDDDVKKTTGGRNGYGAKLTNIFSEEFVVETADAVHGYVYRQVFRKNMSAKEEPKLTKNTKKETWTCITFKPDLKRFKMTHLDDDVVALFTKRVYDLAGSTPADLKVFLNGKRLPIKNFRDYCALYPLPADAPVVHERVNERWEVLACVSDGSFQSVSFVNSINTLKGGSHVAYVTDQMVESLMNVIKKKTKSTSLKPFHVKNYLWVFVNSLVENPAFDSQSKETLTTKKENFGSTAVLGETFLKELSTKCGVVEKVVQFANFKDSTELRKSDGSKKLRLPGIPKLDDANEAGGRNSHKCTLILTEGDSAKALAVSGLSVVGRDYYGVFPLRGKLLNVREASTKQIKDNQEIMYLKQILGLKQNRTYDTEKELSELRYGHIMIMTDQDHDGSHIKGLIINFIHTFWPALLSQPNFVQEFITPIVKCSKTGSTSSLTFFTIPEYHLWREQLGPDGVKGWSIKYYKGLGTSSSQEAKEYFSNVGRHVKDFEWREDDDLLDLAFSKKKADERKVWLSKLEHGKTFVDHSKKVVPYADFINKELILFSMADNIRSIPSLMDGLKPGQRKILFACFKRKLKAEIKVAQLAGYVAEHSAYHHGEQALASTIVGMAQNFVGSNNINLLFPSGQFGTRIAGGADAASARYIFTRLTRLARCIFHEDDDALLAYLEEDGQVIEPEYYAPIIPMVLVNGAKGIGTGWSTEVPCYNPKDLIQILRQRLAASGSGALASSSVPGLQQQQQLQLPLTPWYRGFSGSVVPTSSGFIMTGGLKRINDEMLEVSELPAGTWTQRYKEFLESLVEEGHIKEFRDHHTDTRVSFVLAFASAEQMQKLAGKGGFAKSLKLTSPITLSNMHLFDTRQHIQRYTSPMQIIDIFFEERMQLYVRRKQHLVTQLTAEFDRLDNKMRFITMVVEDKIQLRNRKRQEIVQDLHRLKFLELDNFEYLLGMSLSSLTTEKVQELHQQRSTKEQELSLIIRTSEKQIWLNDLDALEKALDENLDELMQMDDASAAGMVEKKKKTKKTAAMSVADEEGEVIDLTVGLAAATASGAETIRRGTAATGKARSKSAAAISSAVVTLLDDDEEEDEYAFDSNDNDDGGDDGGRRGQKRGGAPSKKRVVLSDGDSDEEDKDVDISREETSTAAASATKPVAAPHTPPKKVAKKSAVSKAAAAEAKPKKTAKKTAAADGEQKLRLPADDDFGLGGGMSLFDRLARKVGSTTLEAAAAPAAASSKTASAAVSAAPVAAKADPFALREELADEEAENKAATRKKAVVVAKAAPAAKRPAAAATKKAAPAKTAASKQTASKKKSTGAKKSRVVETDSDEASFDFDDQSDCSNNSDDYDNDDGDDASFQSSEDFASDDDE